MNGASSTPCVNGTCQDQLRDYLCTCFGNFTGKNCSIPPGVCPLERSLYGVCHLSLSLSLSLIILSFSEMEKKPPNITQPPIDIFAELFRPVNLTCVSIPGSNPIYHWLQDGVEVATQRESVFVIPGVRPEHRGLYKCVAENAIGIDTSDAALLTIQGQLTGYPCNYAVAIVVMTRTKLAVPSLYTCLKTTLHMLKGKKNNK